MVFRLHRSAPVDARDKNVSTKITVIGSKKSGRQKRHLLFYLMHRTSETITHRTSMHNVSGIVLLAKGSQEISKSKNPYNGIYEAGDRPAHSRGTSQ